jgi:RNA polymerase sigma-70 factor (ECF subfamily)
MWSTLDHTEEGLPKVESADGDVTGLLRAWSAGDREVEDRLFAAVLPELRKLASRYMRREAPGHSLQSTALLNEAYLRLVGARERDWQDRSHFYAIAARIMRRLLIDHARGRRRGNEVPIEGFEELLRGREPQIEQAIAIDSVLDDLERIHPDWCSVVEMRFFLGLTEEETAEALSIPLRTAQRRFSDARRWLYEKLAAAPPEAS